MSEAIKALVDEFRKSGILAKPETFEDQVRYDVMMAIVDITSKNHPSHLMAGAYKLLHEKRKSDEKTEELFEDYVIASKSKRFNMYDMKEYLDEMRSPFYQKGIPGGSCYYINEGMKYSEGKKPSTLHADQMATVEDAYAFRKRYLPLYIEILQDILQNA